MARNRDSSELNGFSKDTKKESLFQSIIASCFVDENHFRDECKHSINQRSMALLSFQSKNDEATQRHALIRSVAYVKLSSDQDQSIEYSEKSNT